MKCEFRHWRPHVKYPIKSTIPSCQIVKAWDLGSKHLHYLNTCSAPHIYLQQGQYGSLLSGPHQSPCSVYSFSQLSLYFPCQLHEDPSGGTWRIWCGTQKTGRTTYPTTWHIWMLEVLLDLVCWAPPPHLNLDFWKDSWAWFSLQPLQQLQPQPQLPQSVVE